MTHGMRAPILTCILLSFCSAGAEDISLYGKIIDTASNPVSKAVIRLLNAGLADTTGADGLFAFEGIAHSTAARSPASPAPFVRPRIENGLVKFSLDKENVRVVASLHDLAGRCLSRFYDGVLGSGSYTLNPRCGLSGPPGTSMYVIVVRLGAREVVLKYTAAMGRDALSSASPGSARTGQPATSLRRTLAAVMLDTLVAEKINFLTGKQTECIKFPIYAYNGTVPDIVFFADLDGDKLTDYEETYRYGTNLKDPDTDGDGWGDYFEVLRFSPTAPDNFSPLLADIPYIEVSMAGSPSVTFNYNQSQSQSDAISLTEASAISEGNTSELTHTDSWKQEHSWSVKLSGGAAVGGEDKFKFEALLETGFEGKYNHEFGGKVSTQKQVTNTQSYENSRKTAASRGFTFESGKISVPVRIRNASNVSCKLETVTLTASYFSAADASYRRVVIGNLVNAEVSGIQINARDSTSIYLFENNAIALAKMEGLIRNASKVFVTVAGYSLNTTFFGGVTSNLTGNITEVGKKTARLVVDYGPAEGKPYVVRDVAVKTKYDKFLEQYQTVSLYDVLSSSGLAFNAGETDRSGTLVSIGGVANGDIADAYWFASILRGTEVTMYPAYHADFKLRDVPVYKQDVVSLIHTYDRDGDGLSAIAEHMYGTSDLSVDTDGDALTDLLEVNGFSRKGVMYRTNPTLKDTDGDGILDLIDDNPCGEVVADSIARVLTFGLADPYLSEAGTLPVIRERDVDGDSLEYGFGLQWNDAQVKLIIDTWKPVSSIRIINALAPEDTVAITALRSFPPPRYMANVNVYPGDNVYTVIVRSADGRDTTIYQLNQLYGLLPSVSDWNLASPAVQSYRKLNAEVRHLERSSIYVDGVIIAEACSTWSPDLDPFDFAGRIITDTISRDHRAGDTVTVMGETGTLSRARILKILPGNLDSSIMTATIDSIIPNRSNTYLAFSYHKSVAGAQRVYSYSIAAGKTMTIAGKIRVTTSLKVTADRVADNDDVFDPASELELCYNVETWTMESSTDYVQVATFGPQDIPRKSLTVGGTPIEVSQVDTTVWGSRCKRWLFGMYDSDLSGVTGYFAQYLGGVSFNAYLYDYSRPDSANFAIVSNPDAPVYAGTRTLGASDSNIFRVKNTQADLRVEVTFAWAYVD